MLPGFFMRIDPAQLKPVRLLQILIGALRLVWASARGPTAFSLGLVILQGLLPLASLLVLKALVDSIASRQDWHHVLIWLVLAGTAALLSSVLRSVSEWAQEIQAARVTEHVFRVLHTQSIALDLQYYEDTSYQDNLHRAQLEAPHRPTSIVNGLVAAAQNALALGGITVLLLSFNWLIGLLLLAAAIPTALARLIYARRAFELEEANTPKERKAWYHHWLLTSLRGAAELRLLDIGNLFAARADEFRRQVSQARLQLSRKRLFLDAGGQVLSTAAVFGALSFIAYQSLAGIITVGALVMYFQAFHTGVGSMQSLLRGLAGLYEDSLFLANFDRFIRLEPKVTCPRRPVAAPTRICEGISFKNVSFSYPGCSRPVLEGIDLHIPAGKIVALIGENGAGKSTLVKLLARLYDPTEGRIQVDGIDLRDFDPAEWRHRLSVVLQDYTRYPVTARENIWLGDVRASDGDGAVIEAAKRAGADRVIDRLSARYETVLGREFDDGSEISVGEWQKVVLARTLFRDAAIYVLDEPTSALDSRAEVELFESFRHLVRERTAVLISHRFSTAGVADYMVVLKGGRVAEVRKNS